MSGAKVYEIVPQEVRDLVDRWVKNFAWGLIRHNTMMRAVATVLKLHGIKRLPLGRYEVVYTCDFGDLPIIHIHGRERVSEACPACGSSAWRYIHTERELPFSRYDIITAFCLDCGCFYRKFGWKVEERDAEQA
ncbi:hypothetical protein SAMN00808754_2073 [Thermanaeromonas toyohensis ToBE]|uniref:Uncharacterized protein n=1 Tax=Thermanaeromonas toyohensis ToBE TaxID=698762 RepID=A0A1W1VX93_9FIRM|nr:hypothetical protein [Thermanaeromonas toyohensis]SMB98002.1 hypothetical protein SAMN00808754_2073 [Thermanaeromonas toyohensis ToBE]